MKKIGRSLFLYLIFMVNVAAADVSIKAEIYPEEVGVGDQARLILTVNSDSDFESEDPDFPASDAFKIIEAQNGGKSSSSRMSFVNGKSQFSKTVSQHYEFVIEFLKSGLVTIPSISVKVNGAISASSPLKVQVSTSSQQSNQRGTVQQPRGRRPLPEEDPFGVDDDMFTQLMKQRQKILEEVQGQFGGGGFSGGTARPQDEIPNLKLDVNTNESFFVYADTNKTTAYEGEQITTNWYIYVKGTIDSLDRAKFPDLKGFWKEIIEEVPSLQFTHAIVNGIPYKRALLASHALFPIKAGTSVIDEFKIKATVRNLTQFGWGKPNEYTKSSRRLPIEVLPLPPEGKPLSFSGAVGQFQMQPSVDSQQVKAGQPFSLKVKFEGQGNAKLIELPPIQWPETLTVFDTKSDSKFFKNGQSYKAFEILLIQNQEGPFKIPAIVFSYFDPELKKYVTKNTEEMQLTALKSDQPLEAVNMPGGAKTGKAEAIELVPILEWPGSFSWQAQRNLFLSSLMVLGFVLLSLQFAFSYVKITGRPSLVILVSEKIKKLDAVRKKQDLKGVGAESVNLIYVILEAVNSDRSNQKNITEQLSQLPIHYKEKYEARLADIFQYFQMIGFAPDEVRNQLLSQKNLDQELTDLKSISKEIAQDLGRQHDV